MNADHSPQSNQETPAQSREQPKSIPITRVFLLGWRELFQSRERILRNYYLAVARANQLETSPEASLDELRTHVLTNQPQNVPSGEYAVDRIESKLVLVSRLLAFWQVFWLSLLPFALTAWWAYARIDAMPQPNPGRILMTCGLGIAMFFVLTVFGVLALALCSKPYIALLNRILRLPEFIG